MELTGTIVQQDTSIWTVPETQVDITSDGPKKRTLTYTFVLYLAHYSREAKETIGVEIDDFDESNSLTKEDLYELKEKNWHKLVGKRNFQSLDKKSRDFLVNTAGAIEFGYPIDIRKTYQYSIYDDED